MSMSDSDNVHSLSIVLGGGSGAYLELVLASLGGRAGVEEIDSEDLVARRVSRISHQSVRGPSSAAMALVGLFESVPSCRCRKERSSRNS